VFEVKTKVACLGLAQIWSCPACSQLAAPSVSCDKNVSVFAEYTYMYHSSLR